jgi:hypothetical protein
MRILISTDVSETKRTALLYLVESFCNDAVSFPSSDFARFLSRRSSTEDLVAALELPEADLHDCAAWNLSSEEWYAAQRQALIQHIVEALQSEATGSEQNKLLTHGRPGEC